MFHGYGEACTDQVVVEFDDMIASALNANVHCIDIGATRYAEEFNSFKTIAEKSCEMVKINPDFQGEFNIVGQS